MQPLDPAADDVALLARTAAGDRRAFAVLVERHRDAVFRFARLLAGSDTEAEDVMQETFIAALGGAAGFRGEGTVRGWLLTIARRSLLHARRRRVGEPARLEPLEALGEQAGWGDARTPAQIEGRLARQELLDAALRALTTEDREVLLARDLEGLSAEETAQMLGTSVVAVKSRLHRARLRAMAAIRAAGGERHD